MKADTSAYKKSSFGPAFLFLDAKKRHGLAVYYAFCRLMDDIADEAGMTDRVEQLDFWRQEVDRVFAGQATTELGKELAQTVAAFGLEKDRFLDLIDGMKADVQGRTYGSLQELEWYLWHVAGIVGLATLDILGIKGERARSLARKLGFAVQLTNIVRDVAEDALLGRVYLPTDLLDKQGITAADVLANKTPTQIAAVRAQLAEKAENFYKQANEDMAVLPARKMIPCRVMAFVYRANLAKIKETGFRAEKAVKLSKWEKVFYSVYAIFKTDIHL